MPRAHTDGEQPSSPKSKRNEFLSTDRSDIELGDDGRTPGRKRKCRQWRKILTACLAAPPIILFGKMLGQTLFDHVHSSVDYFSTGSLDAISVYVSIYVVSCSAGAPLTPFEVMSGYLFGWSVGMLVDMTGRFIASVLCFTIARLLMRLGCAIGPRNPVMKGVGKAVQDRGLSFLVLFNLLYVPVALKNYGLGFVPEVALWRFALAILIVEVPMASVWAFIGAEARANGVSLEDLRNGEGHGPFGLVIVGVAMIAFAWILHVLHHRVGLEFDRQKKDAGGENEIGLDSSDTDASPIRAAKKASVSTPSVDKSPRTS